MINETPDTKCNTQNQYLDLIRHKFQCPIHFFITIYMTHLREDFFIILGHLHLNGYVLEKACTPQGSIFLLVSDKLMNVIPFN